MSKVQSFSHSETKKAKKKFKLIMSLLKESLFWHSCMIQINWEEKLKKIDGSLAGRNS